MPYFRSNTKRTQGPNKNQPAYGMKYPGLINSFSHQIYNYRQIRRRVNALPKEVQEAIFEWMFSQKLTDPSAAIGDFLGQSVAISSDGQYIVGGSPLDDEPASAQGSLVVFELSGGSYVYSQKLTDPSAAIGDGLGQSVAISSDGQYIVGGSPDDDEPASNQGSLVVFELSGGSYVYSQKLTDPSATSGDRLGASVTISSDGQYIVGGSPLDDEPASAQGSLVVFELSGGSYVYSQKLTDPSATSGDLLGHSVAISSDGQYIVGGSIGDDEPALGQGSLVVFGLSGGSYVYSQKLTDPSATSGDKLGQSVAISSDGQYIVGGSPGDDEPNTDQGSLVVFELSGGSYVYRQTLTDPSGENLDNLGQSVAISSDGQYIVGGPIGDDEPASNQGSLVVFELSGGSYVYRQTLTDPSGAIIDNLGQSVAISSNGQYIVGGSIGDDEPVSSQGSLSVFTYGKK